MYQRYINRLEYILSTLSIVIILILITGIITFYNGLSKSVESAGKLENMWERSRDKIEDIDEALSNLINDVNSISNPEVISKAYIQEELLKLREQLRGDFKNDEDWDDYWKRKWDRTIMGVNKDFRIKVNYDD